MNFGLVSILLLTTAAVCIIGSMKLLIAKNYFMQFLRGFAGVFLLVVAVLVILSSLNIASYAQLTEGRAIANVSFVQENEQVYVATVVNVTTGETTEVKLEGDLWQVDARIMRVIGSSTPFYKLERISGRYYSLEDERTKPRSVHGLSGGSSAFDLFSMFKDSGLGIIKAQYGSATYLPIADTATFTVAVAASGLVAKPVNDAARNIVAEWQ